MKETGEPMAQAETVIFTDLDGTLLDGNYRCDPAQPLLQRLRELGIPVVFASSKTRAEVERLRRDLGNRDPYIVENGAAILIPEGLLGEEPARAGCVRSRGVWQYAPARQRTEILTVLGRLRQEHGFRFRAFHDLDPGRLAAITGLDPEAAALALRRQASEPLEWKDSPARLDRFRELLRQEGLELVRGGRFLHVQDPACDKGRAMLWLLGLYARHRGAAVRSIALGDSENDRQMLELADVAVVVPGAAGERLSLQRREGVVVAPAPGPAGWARALSRLLGLDRQASHRP
ncbi:MAG: HAD-IIB family hydrolase [Gammaproteobacteria bacterium]|nr:MAG: HAD-IIB family hydrolase [Gammaproteobacteria bacterium]